MTFPTYTLPSEPTPTGYQLQVGGVRRSYVFPTYDEAFTAAQDERLDDYEIVPVDVGE